jgi:hypothetical protein
MFESNFRELLQGLKDQGTTVEIAFINADEHVFLVDGYLLTTEQILMLRRKSKLNLAGIIEFDQSERATVEKDLRAAQALCHGGAADRTARDFRDFINLEFERCHSLGQIRAVSERLGIQYAGI